MARTSWTEADAEAFDALAQHLIQRGADPEDRFPQGGLTADQRALLVDGFDFDELAGNALLQGWSAAIGSRPDIRSIDPTHRSLRGFAKKGTNNRRQRLAQQENALEVAEAAMRRRSRPSARGVPQQGPDANQLINSGSASLMAKGFLLRERAGRLWYDEFHQAIFLDWDGAYDTAVVPACKLTDAAERRIAMWLRSLDDALGDCPKGILQEAIYAAAEEDRRNEVLDWLRGLAWDGTERLPGMLQRIFKAPDTLLNRAIGPNLMIGMVARVLKPGTKLDTMVVLRGGQGLNKSTACQILGGKWYAQSHSSVDSKDFVQELRGLMVLEVAELHSFLATRSGASRVKAMITVEVDRYRSSYGRHVQDFPRTLTLMGTTNDRAVLNDPMGGRRYMIVDTPLHIDLETLRAEREQLFAEAVHRFKAGAKWWEFPKKEHAEMIETASIITYMQERLEDEIAGSDIYDGVNRLQEEIVEGLRRPALQPVAPSLETTGDQRVPVRWGTLLTTHRCAHWLGITPRDAETGQVGRKLQEALRGMGFEPHRLKVATDHKVVRAWLRARSSGLSVKRAGARDGSDELPF